MLTKKKPATFEERLNEAHATADAAVSVVESIAADLDQAVVAKSEIISDIDAESARLLAALDNLSELRTEAVEARATTLAKANKFRALVSA